MFRAGHILYGLFPTGERKERPCIVLIDEQPDGQVLLTYTSSKIDFLADTTTILPKGCHEEITRESCVVYEEALLVKASNLRLAVSASLYRFDPARKLSASEVARVQQGITSDLTPVEIRLYAAHLKVILPDES
jgi:hypothetical protein